MPSAKQPPPKVLVPEKLSPDGLALLRASLEVDERKDLDADELLQIIPEYEALVVRSETKVTANLLRAAKQLKVVARAGVGVDNVDVEEATKLGIVVVNSPSGNIGAAAEHTIALLMAMARNIPEACSSLKSGKWERSKFVGVEVKGKALSIIGLGKVGLTVARLAKGLGMNVNALDPYASPAVAASASVTLVSSLSELLTTADFLTIHTPLIASTKGMISTAELAQMKPGSRILNVARGGTIDEAALLVALESGHLAAAAIDVFTSEPPEPDSTAARLIAHPRAVVTPHLGASTVEAQENVSIDVCEQVLQILNGSLPRSAVNAPLILPDEYRKLQPFVRLVEKMGSLYTQHYASSVGGSMTRNTFDLIYHGEVAGISNTRPLFAALIKGLLAPISSSEGININIVNAELVARERGIFVNEQHSRDPADHSYSSLVTLVARPPSRASSRAPAPEATSQSGPNPQDQRIISGTCSGDQPLINRLGRFETSFVPEGTLLICENYDSPGKIGAVGSLLGQEGVNINFMTVAPVSRKFAFASGETDDGGSKHEALMILGIDKVVDQRVADGLVKGEES
ncbi:D-3-phosphoglycerate dehydrogenase [Aspergillus novofumigatus IBT 16806]|uniref:D-3-phosphoglycerate dehydrogenase n=1 Tax=Aspergillus novofumigatus (strain IBT 16806) TaxID=1392255 RepID=A0A2I1CLA3_ASPN1|nr:d-3-phosphoglycerate dehydrogenase [Aspergillus novofumigatus IBT 16806]PKX98376.1 d-3-phosphoglycerate dehydrogenase [Aspergillus novofumigatus IBT 16806]